MWMSDGAMTELDKIARQRVGVVLGRIPQGRYIMTAKYEKRERAVLVSWVQQASFNPPMVLVALHKERDIGPLIHESHAFALNQVAAEDRLTIKRFTAPAPRRPPDDEDDNADHPLQAMSTLRKATGSPILAKAMCYMDCDLVRHVDVDGDHDLYVGQIRDAGVLHDGEIPVHLRDNGFQY